MTVQELINLLNQYPMDMDVCQMDVENDDEDSGGVRNLKSDDLEEVVLHNVTYDRDKKCLCILWNN